MIVGTFMFRIVRWWLTLIQMLIFNPLMILKVSFLWFCMSFAASYIFFLIVHKYDVLDVRKDLAIALGRSFLMGAFVATLLISLYQFILTDVMISRFFATQQHFIASLNMMSDEFVILYQKFCFLTVLLSGLFASHYVGEMLDAWHDDHISNRYGWSIMAITLLCWGFLWGVNYII
ncbi:hypothetical protein KBB68_00030 [Candidatus Babeliales bacterium]|nr:hypothetical protein [Candidatus Babeliales bacterium]